MNAKDFRIGNLVYSKSCNCNFPKGIIEVDFEAFRKIHLFDALSGLEPIQLTEEWLLNFGYEVTFVDFRHFYKLKDLYLDDNFQPCDTFIRYDLKYVHQLQNLYFALTQKELNYKKINPTL